MTKSPHPIVLISGGSRGLGAALVSDLLANGYGVATFSRAETPFVADLRQADPNGERFRWEALDGNDFPAMRRFVLGVQQSFGRLDGLVNNAAVGGEGLLALTPDEEIRRTIAVNFEAVVHLTRQCTRGMLVAGGGSIVNISSIHARRGHAGVALYSATKAAVDGLTRSLARELGPRGIRVNSVAPGYFESAMVSSIGAAQRAAIARRTPLGRLATVEDIVPVVRFLLSPDARFISGQVVTVDGGLTC
jgi:3-oxoacyl-[acyl-carrier protein] reductase